MKHSPTQRSQRDIAKQKDNKNSQGGNQRWQKYLALQYNTCSFKMYKMSTMLNLFLFTTHLTTWIQSADVK